MRVVGPITTKELKKRYRYSDGKKQTIRTYVGLHSTLESAMPAIGSAGGVGGKVVSVELGDAEAHTGRMEVVEEETVAPISGGGSEPLGDDIQEIDWAEERLPLEKHPKCFTLNPSRHYYEYPYSPYDAVYNKSLYAAPTGSEDSKYKQRDWTCWAVLENSDIVRVGGWTLDQYKELKAQGHDDFTFVYPILSYTSFSTGRPSWGSGVGKIGSPAGGGPSGFVYIKSADRVAKVSSQKWQRTQQWRGLIDQSVVTSLLYAAT